MGWQWVVPVARSGEHWRRGRKLLDRGLRPGATALHRPMLQTRARDLLSRLLKNPQQWEGYIDLSVESTPSLITFLKNLATI
jgi:cytochrome P450